MAKELIIGIDEAGRGALAGPVYAACCLLSPECDISILNDSKQLSSEKRKIAREKIISSCSYGIGFATHKEIDEINILQATFLAMQRAFENFLKCADDKSVELANAQIIVDGSILPPFLEKWDEDNLFCEHSNFTAKSLVKADAKIPAVMAASILAKTSRDEFMLFADKKWPEYSYRQHKGYGTLAHREVIKLHGISPIGRRSFSIK